jgi:hypothetical protein
MCFQRRAPGAQFSGRMTGTRAELFRDLAARRAQRVVAAVSAAGAARSHV